MGSAVNVDDASKVTFTDSIVAFNTGDGTPNSPQVFRSAINDDGTAVSFDAYNGTGADGRTFWAWAICASA